jgi:hypothetical protein
MIQKPVSVYINWSAYDELSDTVQLTEEIAMRELEQLLRWRKLGAQFDYYLVDAFWYSRSGGFREFRKPHWPDGPVRFLEKCLQNNIKPGLWLPSNNQFGQAQLDVHPAWEDSWNPTQHAFCLFSGGYLPHLLESMDIWYQHGVRAFKFDFTNFNAVTPALEKSMLPSEIRLANENALRIGLKSFRAQHQDVLLLGYNGFEEQDTFSKTDLPLRRTIDPHWLDVFDSLYCGDPRPSDVPAMNFWRAKDVYSDHMVRYFEEMGFPLQRIDSAGFMIGTTGTCYYRGAAAWQGMLLLSLARGGWVNTYYGNLELLDDNAVRWFAQAQEIFFRLQEFGRCTSFGVLPGSNQGGYGFKLEHGLGSVAAVVNPTQAIQHISIPAQKKGRILSCDSGFTPGLKDAVIELGPEQMALVGFGAYATAEYDLGVISGVCIPETITLLETEWQLDGKTHIRSRIKLDQPETLRIIVRQATPDGRAWRSTGGSPPDGITLGNILSIRATQSGHALDVKINYDKAIWSGLSWAVGEVTVQDVDSWIELECTTTESQPVSLKAELYRVEYRTESPASK